MAEMGGYRSPVDLGLGRMSDIKDPELFGEFTDVYNAIHLINAYLDRLRLIAEGGGSGQSPSTTMPFNRFFVSTALQPIAVGDLVSPSPISGQNGVIKGALSNPSGGAAPVANFVGIALTAAAVGEDLRVGVGPAALEVPGTTGGSYVWGYSSVTTAGTASGLGGLYTTNPGAISVAGGTAYPMPVAVGLLPGFALFGQFHQR